MKKLWSLLSCLLICVVLVQQRATNISPEKPLKVTTWDAFGYYIYLPAFCIYDDCKELKWVDSIDRKYGVSGGDGLPATKLDDGNYTFKYLGGVAIMELPFFAAAHLYAKNSAYPADGFSAPYQYALGFGVIFCCLLALLLLRHILNKYFPDTVTAITLLLLCAASNFIQYAAVDNAQSHAYIFLLYVLILWATIKWHERPTALLALVSGLVIGFATMSRPTEAIMLFIPLLWNTHNKIASKEKWQLVRKHRSHLFLIALGGLIGVLPQIIYWKLSTGHFIYDVGSKWVFLNPWFRVLIGWEKGWFIYTPVAILFVAGLFFLKKYPFKNSVLWFCILNIWIIIAWDDWRYGGSYSTRALVQSYPVFAFALAALVERLNATKWKYALYVAAIYLIGVNLFQVVQYNKTILHYNDMNRAYYSRIYLNPHPAAVDYSLLDVEDFLSPAKGLSERTLCEQSSDIDIPRDNVQSLLSCNLNTTESKEQFIRVDARIQVPGAYWNNYLEAELRSGDSVKHVRVRLYRPEVSETDANEYSFYMKVPEIFRATQLTVFIKPTNDMKGSAFAKAILLQR